MCVKKKCEESGTLFTQLQRLIYNFPLIFDDETLREKHFVELREKNGSFSAFGHLQTLNLVVCTGTTHIMSNGGVV